MRTTDTLPDVTATPLFWRLYAQLSTGTGDWVVVDDFSIQVIDQF